MTSSHPPAKGHQTSKLVAPSAGRPPRTPPDITSVCDGRGKSAQSGGRAASQPSGTFMSSPGGEQDQQPSKSACVRPADPDTESCSKSDTAFLGSDIIAGLTSTGNYVSLKYDPSLGNSKSRGVVDVVRRGTSPGKLTNESKTVVDNHIQASDVIRIGVISGGPRTCSFFLGTPLGQSCIGK